MVQSKRARFLPTFCFTALSSNPVHYGRVPLFNQRGSRWPCVFLPLFWVPCFTKGQSLGSHVGCTCISAQSGVSGPHGPLRWSSLCQELLRDLFTVAAGYGKANKPPLRFYSWPASLPLNLPAACWEAGLFTVVFVYSCFRESPFSSSSSLSQKQAASICCLHSCFNPSSWWGRWWLWQIRVPLVWGLPCFPVTWAEPPCHITSS